MHTIVDRQELTKRDLISLTIEAPQIARKIRPGQFVVLRVNDTGERMPLTVAYRDAANGTVTIVFQVVGKSTAMLASLAWATPSRTCAGRSAAGALREVRHGGRHRRRFGHRGAASPAHRAPRAGNHIIGMVGAREKDLLILEDEMRVLCDELLVTTDDGSYGMHGKVTDALSTLVERHEHIDRVIAVGPLIMMRAVTEMTRIYGLPTQVSLNPIMVDGTGMCGGCRCRSAVRPGSPASTDPTSTRSRSTSTSSSSATACTGATSASRCSHPSRPIEAAMNGMDHELATLAQQVDLSSFCPHCHAALNVYDPATRRIWVGLTWSATTPATCC